MKERNHKRKEKRRKLVLFFAFILLLSGVGVMLYPRVQQWRYARDADKKIEAYESLIKELQEEEEDKEDKGQEGQDKQKGNPEGNQEMDLAWLLEEMKEYNRELDDQGQSGLKDAWSYQQPSFELSRLGLPEDMMGYITIPRMDVTLPIYLGATEENMRLGAVHLTETSLPIGSFDGVSTNSVLAAHRGYTRALMFSEIEKLQLGDTVKITNFWEELTYHVAEIKVIDPKDIREILIQDGRDLVTLITCHPYGQNYQRYIVYCERSGS